MNGITKQLAEQAQHSRLLWYKYKYETEWTGEHAKVNKKVNVNFMKNELEYRLRLLNEHLLKNNLMHEYDAAMQIVESKIVGEYIGMSWK